MNNTIRNNIIFEKKFEQLKFQQVIKMCYLIADLEKFPTYEFTEVGERGINMSGGQRQRIQLARTVYDEADIYLIDDCFSALDSESCREIMK